MGQTGQWVAMQSSRVDLFPTKRGAKYLNQYSPKVIGSRLQLASNHLALTQPGRSGDLNSDGSLCDVSLCHESCEESRSQLPKNSDMDSVAFGGALPTFTRQRCNRGEPCSLVPLMNLLLRAIENCNFEERIAILEKRLAAAEAVEGNRATREPLESG